MAVAGVAKAMQSCLSWESKPKSLLAYLVGRVWLVKCRVFCMCGCGCFYVWLFVCVVVGVFMCGCL